MTEPNNIRDKFLSKFVAFYSHMTNDEGALRCPGNLVLVRAFLYAHVAEPGEFIANLEQLRIDCDCKFLESLPSLLMADSPYSIDSIGISAEDENIFDVVWVVAGFRVALEALANKAIGIKINGVGYFPPESIKEILVNIPDKHKTILIVDKNGFSPIGAIDDKNEGSV